MGTYRMGKKSKSKKILRGSQRTLNKSLDQKLTLYNSPADFPSLKNFHSGKKVSCTLFAELPGEDTRALPGIFRLFWTPKKSLVKWSHPKEYLPNFLSPKTPGIELLNPAKSFDHPQLLNCLDIQSTHSPHQCPPPPLPWESQAKMMWRLWKFSFNDILETVDYSTQYNATFRGDE